MDHRFVVRVGDAPLPAALAKSERTEFFVGSEIPPGTPAESVIARNVLGALRSAGLTPTQEAVDLYRFAVAAYVADQRVRRSDYDGWTRPIALHVPVSNLGLWQRAGPILEEFLRFLTGDAWSVYPYESEAARTASVQKTRDANPGEKEGDEPAGVCLLSGGLDSFLGATQVLASGERWLFVSHQAKGSANHQSPAQDRVATALAAEFGAEHVSRLTFDVSRLKMPDKEKPEGTQRSRSAVFLALGTLAASALRTGDGPTPLLIPENGFVSLNVPLTYGRIGSTSTRTTHPHTLALYQRVLDELGLAVTVQNPFRFATKGEMLTGSPATAFARRHAAETVSCSNAGNTYRFSKTAKGHCGHCVPCIVRRAAMYAAGLDRPTPYLFDLVHDVPKLGSGPDSSLKALGMAIARTSAGSAIIETLKSGPLPDHAEEYVGVYERGLAEIDAFLHSADARG